jgi:hypothetical protein
MGKPKKSELPASCGDKPIDHQWYSLMDAPDASRLLMVVCIKCDAEGYVTDITDGERFAVRLAVEDEMKIPWTEPDRVHMGTWAEVRKRR